jgi:hypothetical protein
VICAHALFFCSAVALPALAQDEDPDRVRTETSVEPRSTSIGTPFRYSMKFDVESGIELALPVPTENIGRFFILDFGDIGAKVDAASGRVVYERWYDLIAYETGDDLVPGMPVGWRGPDGEQHTTYLPDTPITIASVLPRAPDSTPLPLEELDLLDIKAPVPPPAAPWPLGWIAAGALIGLSIGTILFRALNRRRAPVERKALAHEAALSQLAALRTGKLLADSRLEEFYVELSSIVRSYLEARFAVRAPEMTTEEFLQAAHGGSALTGEQRGSLQVFLTEADLVKFARAHPDTLDAERAWTAAEHFVKATAERPSEENGDAAA